MLRFSDGINVDTSGELRTLCLSDGWYVVGKGMLCPCRDQAEAEALVKKMTPEKEAK